MLGRWMTEVDAPPPSREDLLVVGDVHLGRRPVGLDDVLAEVGLDARALSPAAALRRVVEHVGEHPPRCVLFAGDLVDEEKDRFEAFGVLQAAAEHLVDMGVPVYAVAGNHDGLVLPRLVERVPGVSLLGQGGTWERVELPGDGPAVDLLGWSFPSRHVRGCPLDKPSFAATRSATRPGAHVVGLLHGDLVTGGDSNYAPVTRARLEQAELDAWFLGHVHAPHDLSGPRPIGYLGSLVGLDPGETGLRGPWRARVTADGVRAYQLDLGPVRWESIDVPLEDADGIDADAVHARLDAVVTEACVERIGSASPGPDVVVVRAHLTGRLTDRTGVSAFIHSIGQGVGGFRANGVPIVLQRVTDSTGRAVDLESLASEPSPIGFVASRLLMLQRGEDDDVLEAARGRFDNVVCNGGWGLDLGDEELLPPSPDAALERAAWRVLDLLLDQREEATG